jgi:hypothetical protein
MAYTPEREEVSMTDGSIVSFSEKQRMKKDVNVVDGRVVLTVAFRNGDIRNFTLPERLVLQAACHGFSQKVGDYVAGTKEIEDMVLGIDEIGEQICAKGEWNSVREGGGSALSGASTLLKALVQVTGKSVEYVKDWLKDKTPAQKTALRNSAELRPVIAELEAAKSKIDTSALLGTL